MQNGDVLQKYCEAAKSKQGDKFNNMLHLYDNSEINHEEDKIYEGWIYINVVC